MFEQVLEVTFNYQTPFTPGERIIENYFKFVSRNSDTVRLMIEFVFCVCVCVCVYRLSTYPEYH